MLSYAVPCPKCLPNPSCEPQRLRVHRVQGTACRFAEQMDSTCQDISMPFRPLHFKSNPVQSDWFGVSTVDKSAANGSACWCWHSLLTGCPDALPGSSHLGCGPFPLVPKCLQDQLFGPKLSPKAGSWLKFGCWIFHGFPHSSGFKNRHGISRPAWLPHWALQARCDWTRQSIPTWASFGKSSTLW